MSFVSVAIGGSALVGAGVGLYSANRAADTQATAARNSLDFQKQTYADNQPRFANANAAFDNANATFRSAGAGAAENYKPYNEVGTAATYSLGRLMGIGQGGNPQQPDYSGFYNSPDYKFAQQQGEQGIERGANARGINLSGGTLRDLSSFNSGLASQQYGNYYNRLMGLSQMGQSAAGGLTTAQMGVATGIGNVAGGIGNLATGAANSNNAASGAIGNTMQGIGQAQASGIVGGANAVTGALSNGMQNSLLQANIGRNPSAYGGSTSTGGANVGYDTFGRQFGA